MKTLELHDLDAIDRVTAPAELEEISTDSPALGVLTDFRQHKPFLVHADTRAVDAEELMLRAHVKMKLVVDDEDNFVGVISLGDLADEKIRARGGDGEVKVGDLMTPKSLVKAFSYQELEQASVQDVLNALQQNALQRHCLVLDTQSHAVRGLIAAGDIARKLHLPLSLHRTPSFSELFAALEDPGDQRQLNG